MSIEKNVQIVKNFLAALGRRDKQGLLALSAEDIEWIIPGENWPLADTHHRHAGLADVLQKGTCRPSAVNYCMGSLAHADVVADRHLSRSESGAAKACSASNGLASTRN